MDPISITHVPTAGIATPIADAFSHSCTSSATNGKYLIVLQPAPLLSLMCTEPRKQIDPPSWAAVADGMPTELVWDFPPPLPIPPLPSPASTSSMAPGERPAPDDAISSDCSSGCQSGWTTYVDHSLAAPRYPSDDLFCSKDGCDVEEEDMSMVSDASSGPPQFFEEEEHDDGPDNWNRRSVVELAEHEEEEESSLLDDTASSLLFAQSMTTFCGDEHDAATAAGKKAEFSCGFSATHFKRKLQSSAPIKPAQESRKKIR